MSGTEKGIDKKLVFIIKEGIARRALKILILARFEFV
jgi:hypothetical protein